MSVNLKSQMQDLMTQILDANQAYYSTEENGSPKMSDVKYGKLKEDLRTLAKAHPEEAIELGVDTVLNAVGAKADINTYGPMYHNPPMLSLDNSYNNEDLGGWHARTKEHGAEEWVTTGKYDGLAWENTFTNGDLDQGGTRGDGDVGEDLTPTALLVPSIPKKLNFMGRIGVRGEVVLSWQNFEKAKEVDNQDYANPRNAAAGIARRKRVGESAQLLEFIAYGAYVEGVEFNNYAEELEWLKSQGFKVAEYVKSSTLQETLQCIKQVEESRANAPYMMDGAVTRVNNNQVFQYMGFTSHHPKAAIASKFAAEQAETKLLDVEWTRGKKGKLSPNARLETILLAGTRVSNALLHTMKIINFLDVRVGDTVQVEKAAEIIPQVVGVRKDLRVGTETPIVAPTHCPICATPIEMRGEYVYCANQECGDAAKNKLLTYVNKINFKGIGPSAAEGLAETGAFSVITDFYRLTEEDFVAAGVAKKNATKLVQSIKDSIGTNKPKEILAGLGIDMVGDGTSEDLTEEAALTIKELCNQSQEYFQRIQNIGEKTAIKLSEWFNITTNVELVEELYSLGVIVDDNANAKRQVSLGEKVLVGQLSDLPFIDMKICFTGTLSNSRDYYVGLLETNGGKFAKQYQKGIDALVVGDNAGSKKAKALKDGVPVWTEQDFMSKIPNV